jgi:hypothetical protein
LLNISVAYDEYSKQSTVSPKIYQELAQQKKEKEDRERANAPKERNYELEHAKSLQDVRSKESSIDEKYALFV